MKNPLGRLIGISLTFIFVIFSWRGDGTTKKEYWRNFEVIEGELDGPYVVASVLDHLLINGKAWGSEKNKLDLKDQSFVLDSLLTPFFNNQLKGLRDTLYENKEITWSKSKKIFESKALKLDTFIEVDNKRIPVLIEQKPVFQVEYHLTIKGDNRYFEISPNRFKDLEYWKYDEETPLLEFIKYKEKIDSLLKGKKQLAVTILKKGDYNWRAPYIINDLDDNELYSDQYGFERLPVKRGTYSEPNENFILWYDNWLFKFIAVVFSIAIFISFLQIIFIGTSDVDKGTE